MKFELSTLLPKPKVIGVGTLCIGEKEKDAQFFEGDAGYDIVCALFCAYVEARLFVQKVKQGGQK